MRSGKVGQGKVREGKVLWELAAELSLECNVVACVAQNGKRGRAPHLAEEDLEPRGVEKGVRQHKLDRVRQEQQHDALHDRGQRRRPHQFVNRARVDVIQHLRIEALVVGRILGLGNLLILVLILLPLLLSVRVWVRMMMDLQPAR